MVVVAFYMCLFGPIKTRKLVKNGIKTLTFISVLENYCSVATDHKNGVRLLTYFVISTLKNLET